MKYLLFFFLSFIPSLIFGQIETNNNSITAKTSFNGRHCRGTHGLCSFDDTARTIDTNSTITYNEVGNTIIIEVNRSRINSNEHFQILREDPQNYIENTQIYYLMEDDFMIPNSISQQLHIFRQDVKINSGMYPLIMTENTITITFNLE
ncbi:hypothetical protein [uncultured Dokdonia sp.]|uniref:hypothetical protein n=1 Tax=uncultured Dokdonia sp. TaxID=575653 RepID=UPI00260EAF70|nr:hypothetical protein [uncultured Dokdonia sp.]